MSKATSKSALEEHMILLIKASPLVPRNWRREWRVIPERRWRFDFAWPEDKIALEVDGGTWSGGRHVRGKGFESDREKGNEAVIAGWKVLHVTSAMLKSGRAITYLERLFRANERKKDD